MKLDRLGDDHVHAVVDAFCVLEEQVPAGQDDDLHAWPVPLARLCDLEAVEPWHGEVGQHDVEGAPAKGLDGPYAIFDGGHGKASVLELVAHELAEVPSVLREQYPEPRPRVSHEAAPRDDMDWTSAR